MLRVHTSHHPLGEELTEISKIYYQKANSFSIALGGCYKFIIMTTESEMITLHIILADDDIDDRQFFEKALKEIPIPNHFTTVNDGEQLMNYLHMNSDHLPDILFLDLSMPRKTGFECLSEIKEDEKLKDLPVIMLSTSFPRDNKYEQHIINVLYTIGAMDYIRKPGDYKTLKEDIHKTLIKVTLKDVG